MLTPSAVTLKLNLFQSMPNKGVRPGHINLQVNSRPVVERKIVKANRRINQ